jgi:Crp-like helix-turn-helix protein
MAERVAEAELERHGRPVSDGTAAGTVLPVSLTHAELASCGTCRETIDNALRCWRRRGIVTTRYRTIVVHDRERLAGIAGIETVPPDCGHLYTSGGERKCRGEGWPPRDQKANKAGRTGKHRLSPGSAGLRTGSFSNTPWPRRRDRVAKRMIIRPISSSAMMAIVVVAERGRVAAITSVTIRTAAQVNVMEMRSTTPSIRGVSAGGTAKRIWAPTRARGGKATTRLAEPAAEVT